MPLLFVLFFLSGATGLVYELIWTRQLVLVFGGTTYAVTTVLVAFMGGLGIGSYLAGRVAHRLRQSGRVYGALELFIGLYALCVPMLLGLAEPMYRAIYPHAQGAEWLLNAARFCVGAVTLVLPTLCMGATLPILVRYVTNRGGAVGESVGLLYGVNTLGAVAGVLATGFVLIPAIGLIATTRCAAAANLLVGVFALVVLRSKPGEASEEKAATPAKRDDALTLTNDAYNAVLVTFAVSGFAAMVYQITWTRSLVMAVGSSTYSFTCILAAFILGLALGSLIVARYVDLWKRPLYVLGLLQLAIGLAAVLVVPVLGRVPNFVLTLVSQLSGSYGALLAAEFTMVIAIMLVPTLLMGAVFPLVTRLISARIHDAGAATGRAYLVNTVGTIAGAFLAGFVMIRSDVLGIRDSIWLAAVLNGVLGAWLIQHCSRSASEKLPAFEARLASWVAVLVIPLIGIFAGKWDPIAMTSAPFLGTASVKIAKADERKIVFYAEGVDVTVAVEQDVQRPEQRALSVNGKTDASTSLVDMPTMLLLGHLGELFGNGGPDVCSIGLGGGLTLAALSRYPQLQRIDSVEISEEVSRAAEQCFSPFIYNVLSVDPRTHLPVDSRVNEIRADGRNHLLLTDRRYDVIVSQPSNPWIAGVSNLFTREFFSLCDARLKKGGTLVLWVQAYDIGREEFRMVVRTLADVFPYVSLWDATGGEYLLLASHAAPRVDLDEFVRRYSTPTVRADLYRAGVTRPERVLGLFIAGGEPLRRWAEGAAINTDDNARLEFAAPRRLLADNAPYAISEELMELQSSPFPDIVVASPQSPFRQRFVEFLKQTVEGRRDRVRAARCLAERDLAGALRAYVDGYRVDPGNIGIGCAATLLLKRLAEFYPESSQDPVLRPLALELLHHRGPLIAPLTGGTLAQIARHNVDLGVTEFEGDYYLRAAEYFEVARSVLPDDPDVLHALALAYGRIDRLDDAIAAIDRVLELQPGNLDALYARAQFAAWTGDVDGAVGRLAIVLARGMRTASELAVDKSFEKIRDDARFIVLLNAVPH